MFISKGCFFKNTGMHKVAGLSWRLSLGQGNKYSLTSGTPPGLESTVQDAAHVLMTKLHP